MDRRLRMRLTVFASGSSGNCYLVQGGGRNVLIDAGISASRIRAGLSQAGLVPTDLDGIFITHEHSDHVKGLEVFLRKAPVPVFAPGMVAAHLRQTLPGVKSYVVETVPEEPVDLSPMRVVAFPTPHDVPQSVGYRMEAEGAVISIATDTGCVTDTMLRYLSGSDIALIEANHDVDMLRDGPYPIYLKRRILSDEGHLTNAECTWLASVLAHSGTSHIVIGHLSRKNNLPERA